MATFQLQPGVNDVIILTDEADTIVVPEGDRSQDRVFNFQPSDRIDISRISGVTPQELLDNSRSRPNSLLLVGSFGTIALFGVAADQLSEDNFIIAGGNQPPIAFDDFAMTMAGTAVEIPVLDNDFDFEGDILSIIDFEATTIVGGTISLDDNNTPDDPFDDFLTYMPPADFFGTDSLIYTISDGGATATATVTVEMVLPVEPPPVARSDFAETTEDIPVDIDVLANDFTRGGGPEVAIASFEETTTNGGTVTLKDNGTPDDPFDDLLEYRPAEGFTGSDSFSYTISNALNIAEAQVRVQVVPTPTPPPGVLDDFASTTVETPVNIDVLANDFNPIGDRFPLVDFQETTANGGTVTRDDNETDDLTDDSLIYTPADGFIGVDSFTYSVSDVFPGAGTATVTVEVQPDTAGLVAVDDTAIVRQDRSETIAVLENDFDPEGRTFGLISFERTTENGGTITRDNNDTPRLTDDGLVYTPAPGFTGVDSFTYSIGDTEGNVSTATVDVIVESAPEPGPVAVDDRASVAAGESETIAVLENDFNPDGDPFGLIFFERTTENGGTVTRDNNNTPRLTDDELIYTAADGFIGEDSFAYSISDALGNIKTAVVNVTVSEPGENEPPVANDDFTTLFDFDAPVEISVLDNDFDPDNDALTIAGFDATTAAGGTVVRDNNDSPFDLSDDFLIYTPDEGFTGTDSFSYSVSDGFDTDTATVNLIVQVIDDTFAFAIDDFAITTENIPVDIFVLDNDFDIDLSPIAIAGFSETAAGGTVTFSDNDTPEDPFDDFLTYSPAEGFTGTDSFSYTITDGQLTSAATVSVTVSDGDNEPPIALDDIASTTEDISVNIFVLDNDFDPDGDPIAIAGFDETTAFDGDVSIQGNTLVYTPAFGFIGTDNFIYTISDGLGGSDAATVNVIVSPCQCLPPFPIDDFAITEENIPVDIFVLDNDFDPDGDSIEIVGFSEITALGGTVTFSDNDFLTYNPAFGFTGTDSFGYTISNGEFTGTAVVTVAVEQIIDEFPVPVDDVAATVVGNSVEIFVLDNDAGPDENISLTDFPEITTAGGTVVRDNNGSPFDLSDDFVIYTPDEGFTGTDSFSYTVSDGELTDTATVQVTVNPLLGLPLIAEDDFAFTSDNVPVAIAVLDNDSGSDGVVELIDFEDVTGNGGIVSLDNNGTPFDLSDDFLTYLPAFGFSGTDSFSYSIGDGSGQTATGFVTVEVGPAANAPPIASDDFAETFPGIPVNISNLDNDFDPSGNPLATIGFEETTENGGIVTRDEDGSLIYTPPADFTGTDSFRYRVSNGGITDTATVSIIVDRIPLDLPPLILDQEVYTSQNDPVDIFVLENQFDPRDIDREIVDFEETPEGGTVTLKDNGTSEDPTDDFLTYSPDPGFTGTDAFSYSISDRSSTSTAFVTVKVLPEGQSAVAMDDFTDIFLLEGNQVNIFVLDNDISLKVDAIALIEFDETAENGGTVTRNDNDTPGDLTDDFLIYTSSDEFFSTDSFSYSISDGSSTDTAVVDVVNFFTIAPPFLPTAFAADDRAFAIANSPANISVLDNDFSFGQSAELTDFDDSTAAGGTITRNENGTLLDLTDDFLVYSPATDFVGTDSFTYSIIDDFSFTSSTAVVNVVVVPADSTVFAADDNAEVIKNNPTSIFVLENDFEVDGNLLEIISFDETTVNGGTVSLEGFFLPEIDEPIDDIIIDPFPPIGGQGYLLYSPADEFTGTDSFTYSISNPDGVTDTATVRVTVAPSPPFAGFAFGETFENAPVTIDVLSSAFDIDRDSISLTDFEANSTFGGTISLEDNGTPGDQTDDQLLYQPATDFTGFDDFNYTITDSSGLTAVGEVSIDILPAPAGLAAVEDFVQTIAGLPVKVGVLDNDFEIDDEPLELISFEQETENGKTVTRFENNTPDDLTDDFLVYEPGEFDEEFFAFDSFSYTIANADGSTDTGNVSVSVEPILTTFANGDRAHTFTDIPINIDVLANDFGVDDSTLELIDFEATTLFASGAIARDDKGTDDLTDDSLIYTPAEGFTGFDSFSYSISDVGGNTATGFVSVTVEPLPSAGFAAIDDLVDTSDNEPVSIPVLDNDFDAETHLELTSFEETTINGGAIARDDKGTDDLTDDELRYTPPAEGQNDFFIFFDSFSYTVRDPDSNSTDTAIVEVEISPEPPSASDDTAETLVNMAVNIPVLDNDFGFSFEPGDLFLSSLVISGFETITANGGRVILDNNDIRDSLIYIPAPGFTGTDSITYSISEGLLRPLGLTPNSTALVTVTVLPETETLGL